LSAMNTMAIFAVDTIWLQSAHAIYGCRSEWLLCSKCCHWWFAVCNRSYYFQISIRSLSRSRILR
jgi:hypothetical protein